jgi:hypothetical protein
MAIILSIDAYGKYIAQLTPFGIVILEKPKVSQQVKKFQLPSSHFTLY